ncbi:MAG: Macrolide export ATP-binding/permease protein MacB [candidate division BRC1 bacterium ADurb.BinA364]|nr:MAG: Macrolide export ATP-binding/permease protein MacB [candidate division BRC1 bacterium ADurb.BinA364]
MTLWRLIRKEIGQRRMNFLLGALSAMIAVGTATALLTLLQSHDLRTAAILEAKQKTTEAEMARMEDDYRRIMKELGFNMLILPNGQDLAAYYSEGEATLDMPEDYVNLLARANLMQIQHILPIVEKKIRWPEQGMRSIVLIGTRGETPGGGVGTPREPIMVGVPKGLAVVGHEIWDSLGLKQGDPITILGRTFRVGLCQPERGTRDDISVWIDLAEAQAMLDMPGRINAIQALKCLCENNDLETVRAEVNKILPGAKVVEFTGKVVTRALAREKAAEEAARSIASEKAHRATMRAETETLAAWLIPLAGAGAAAWLALLMLANVRERRAEIGMLRALGLRSRQIMAIFLSKAFLIGLIGGALGYAVGFGLGLLGGEAPAEASTASALFRPALLAAALAAAPALAMLASWLPALLAARQDPAVVLREE